MSTVEFAPHVKFYFTYTQAILVLKEVPLPYVFLYYMIDL